MPWEKCDITWGNTAKNLPSTCNQGGSQTTHAMTRAAHAAAMDAKRKLQEIAARDLGGRPEDYELGNERVVNQGRPRDEPGAGGATRDRARRQVRRPRAARRHQCHDQSVGDGAGRPGADGRGARQLRPRRRVEVVRRGICRGRSRRRDRRVSGCSISSRSPTSARSSIRATWAGRRSAASCWGSVTRSDSTGSTTSTTACRWRSASTRTSRRRFSTRPLTMQWAALDIPDPGDAGRGARRRRSAGRRRLHGAHERDCRRGRPRGVSPRAGHGRRHPGVARGRAADARAVDGEYLGPGAWAPGAADPCRRPKAQPCRRTRRAERNGLSRIAGGWPSGGNRRLGHRSEFLTQLFQTRLFALEIAQPSQSSAVDKASRRVSLFKLTWGSASHAGSRARRARCRHVDETEFLQEPHNGLKNWPGSGRQTFSALRGGSRWVFSRLLAPGQAACLF